MSPGSTDTRRQGKLNPASGLLLTDIEKIVALTGLGGKKPNTAQQWAHAVVHYSGRKYKVCACASAAEADENFMLLSRTGDLFSACYGWTDNCLVFDFAEGSPSIGDERMGEDVGHFLADLAAVTTEPMRDSDYEAWVQSLLRARIFLGRTASHLRTYLARASAAPIQWNMEYLDAVPKNYVYPKNRKIVCIDSKHLYPGPRGVSLVKLHANVGQYCRAEDYAEIRKAYDRRIPDNRLDDPGYFNFLLVFYSLFFLVVNAGKFPWSMNVANEENRIRKKRILAIIGASRWDTFLEGIWWGVAYKFFRALKFPGRVIGYVRRRL
jgi:hypothetical protein